MISAMARLAQPFLLAMEPEQAHSVSIRALKAGAYPRNAIPRDQRLVQRYWDLGFPNPLGVAPGFDKNAEVADALLDMGMGFAEAGTITPRPQSGNPKPRVFRLAEDKALINRLGFNNHGHGYALRQLANRRQAGVLGINIGANKDSADRIDDYVRGVKAFAPHASYFTVNISSPNTPGLRDLQHEEALNDLLRQVMAARDESCAGGRTVPVLLKIAPDLAQSDIESIAAAVSAHNLDGMIVSNTTLSRDGLVSRARNEAGGMSGRPLFERATIVLARVRKAVGPDLPIIGVGGIHSAESAVEKLRAGANLLQLYSALVYGGLSLAEEIVAGLSARLDRDRLDSLAPLIGIATDEWASKSLPEDNPK